MIGFNRFGQVAVGLSFLTVYRPNGRGLRLASDGFQWRRLKSSRRRIVVVKLDLTAHSLAGFSMRHVLLNQKTSCQDAELDVGEGVTGLGSPTRCTGHLDLEPVSRISWRGDQA